MQIIIVLITTFLLFVISLEYNPIAKLYAEDLVIDEKVQITISKDNKTLIVPAKIGIDPKLWKDHSLDYHSFDPNQSSPLNTKNYNGTIHIKSIYDRDFTLSNFLDIWGFDKSKIKNIYCNKTIMIMCNINLTLTDGLSLKLQIKNDNEFNTNFSKYVSQRMTFDYPSKWKLANDSIVRSEYLNEMTLRNQTFLNLIKIFPKESEYLTTPLFSILITKLDSNNTGLDEYYKNNLYKLLQADENTFPHFIDYNETEIDGNLAYLILLETTLVAEPGSFDKDNKIIQKETHIWIIKEGYFYDISFKAFNTVYNNYGPIVNKIINSIQIQ